jgi:transposase-like protein
LEFEEEQRNGVPKPDLATAEQDVGKLRREIASLREENDILEKAAIYFARASR